MDTVEAVNDPLQGDESIYHYKHSAEEEEEEASFENQSKPSVSLTDACPLLFHHLWPNLTG